jgi:hypothetical protein
MRCTPPEEMGREITNTLKKLGGTPKTFDLKAFKNPPYKVESKVTH